MKEQRQEGVSAETILFFFLFIGGISFSTTQHLSPDLVLGVGIFSTPVAVAVDPDSDALFVVDSLNDRVLRFDNRGSLTTGSPFDFVFGQNSSAASRVSLNQPQSAWVASNTLWVADSQNNRVLAFSANTTTLSPVPSAFLVLGQTDFQTGAAPSPPSSASMANPSGVMVDSSGTLWVTDPTNNRVLVFYNARSGVDGLAASSVVGQPNFANGNQVSPSASTLAIPNGVISTSAGLFVADTGNNRVLFYPATELVGVDPPATAVYGQSNFSNNQLGPATELSLHNPVGLAVDSQNRLFVSDTANNRILIFPPIPPNGQANISAIDVIGQSVFTNSFPGLFNFPQGITFDQKYNSLWVADTGHNRVLRFSLGVNVDNNATDVTVTFGGRTPDVTISPKASPTSSTSINPATIEEITANGHLVKSASFPQTSYSISTSIDSQQNQIFQFTNNIISNLQVLQLEYQFFAVASNLSSAGISFNTFPGTLKLSLTLSNWNFSSPSNTLHIHLSLTVQPSVTNISQSTSGNITSFTLLSSNILKTTINMLHLGIADNTVIVPVSIFLNSSSSSTLDLELVIPSFNSSFHYDPDFAVTLIGGGNGNGGDGGGGNLLPLLALIALVIPVTFVLLAVVVATVLMWRKWKSKAAATHAVNFSNEEEAVNL